MRNKLELSLSLQRHRTAGAALAGLFWSAVSLIILCLTNSFSFVPARAQVEERQASRVALGRLYRIRLNNRTGFIDETGKVVITPRFRFVDDFSEGYAAVGIGGGWAFIDETGKVRIEPRFQLAHDFSEGLAAVEINGKWGYIDKVGKFIIDPQFKEAGQFHNGYARVLIGNDSFYINSSGKRSEIPFCGDVDFSEGLTRIQTAAGIGFADQTGKVVIKPQFKGAEHFSEGLAA